MVFNKTFLYGLIEETKACRGNSYWHREKQSLHKNSSEGLNLIMLKPHSSITFNVYVGNVLRVFCLCYYPPVASVRAR